MMFVYIVVAIKSKYRRFLTRYSTFIFMLCHTNYRPLTSPIMFFNFIVIIVLGSTFFYFSDDSILNENLSLKLVDINYDKVIFKVYFIIWVCSILLLYVYFLAVSSYIVILTVISIFKKSELLCYLIIFYFFYIFINSKFSDYCLS